MDDADRVGESHGRGVERQLNSGIRREQVTNPFNKDLTYTILPRSSFEMHTALASSQVLTGSVRVNPTGDTATPEGLVDIFLTEWWALPLPRPE